MSTMMLWLNVGIDIIESNLHNASIEPGSDSGRQDSVCEGLL